MQIESLYWKTKSFLRFQRLRNTNRSVIPMFFSLTEPSYPPPPPSPRFTPPALFGPSLRWIAPSRKKTWLRAFSFHLFQGAFHSTQNSGNSGWFIKWNGPFRFVPTGIFGTSFEGGPQWPVWSFRSVEPKCPFPFAKIVVPSTALLYPAYRNN